MVMEYAGAIRAAEPLLSAIIAKLTSAQNVLLVGTDQMVRSVANVGLRNPLLPALLLAA